MSILSSVFSGLLAAVKSEEEQALLPPLAAMFNNVALNPTTANFVAQGNLFLSEAIAAQAKIGQDVLKSIAADLAVAAQEVANQQNQQQAVNQAAPAPAPAPATAAKPSVGSFLAGRAAK